MDHHVWKNMWKAESARKIANSKCKSTYTYLNVKYIKSMIQSWLIISRKYTYIL